MDRRTGTSAAAVAVLLVGFGAVAVLTGVQTGSDVRWVVIASRVGIGVVSVLAGLALVRLRERGPRRRRDGPRRRGRR
ncbi:hypothetical protein [Curtobacterium sp. MCBA15_004]|uniref:hypothetical protein n=1 Tax=unclassified Curtobacterium TaxID=257496 RepID=UPI0008DCBE59|nr:hypothetical protein [Curtobacterium sp. MCBA15_004]WIA96517.1 hypothetical protein QOL16_15690 [Curtobacterium sp. MCBA15_004]